MSRSNTNSQGEEELWQRIADLIGDPEGLTPRDVEIIRAYKSVTLAESKQPPSDELLGKYTEQELHDLELHPDYEYATTTTARKSGESIMPEGDGWEPNDKVVAGGLGKPYRRNWERFDFTEDEYWRRKKL